MCILFYPPNTSVLVDINCYVLGSMYSTTYISSKNQFLYTLDWVWPETGTFPKSCVWSRSCTGFAAYFLNGRFAPVSPGPGWVYLISMIFRDTVHGITDKSTFWTKLTLILIHIDTYVSTEHPPAVIEIAALYILSSGSSAFANGLFNNSGYSHCARHYRLGVSLSWG